MNTENIETAFKNSVAQSIRLLPEGENRYHVFTPFHFDDGDHFVIILEKNHNNKWHITDRGHTYMHISYCTDINTLSTGTRNSIINNTLEKHHVTEVQGQLVAQIDEMAHAGNILYNYIQCLNDIVGVSYWSREQVRSTFIADLEDFIQQCVPAERLMIDYINVAHDNRGTYPVDYCIVGNNKPLHIYGIKNNAKCRDATISMLQFQHWNEPFVPLGIFEDLKSISKKVLSRFTDVCPAHFSTLMHHKDEIEKHIKAA